ncbi:DUF6114 domain-containing protein [Micromonospora sp. MW-13]|uniref:DUF6114 domain-containing protein n=1 Tax=Micromonospora sp. MW-13 TaxID=2094022 RepID=UPI000E448CDE|nr:DUF6114 domain-containing protein [Micromonospora sp. MW-13]
MTSEHRQEEYVTTANPQHAQPGRLSQAWRGFRRWRRSRPFWGGLFTALAGVEIFSTTQMSLSGLTFQMGPTGFLSWLIPVILVACGMLMWFTPQQRMFYAIVGAVTAVFSLIGVNLGGFFIGLLLGMVGSALGFAWVPSRRPATEPAPAPAEPEPVAQPDDAGERDDEPALVDELMPRSEPGEDVTGPLTDTLPRPRNPLREPLPADQDHDSTQVLPTVGPDGRPQGGPYRDPKLLAVTLVLLSVSAAGVLALRDQSPVRAAPAVPCLTPSHSSTSPAAPRPSASRPAGESPSSSPTPSPGPGKTPGGNPITDIIDGIGDLLTGGDDGPATGGTDGATAGARAPAGASPTATVTPTRGPTSSARPTPDASAGTGKPGPDGPGCATPGPGEVEAGKPLPRIAAEPGQPRVAAEPSKLTGSKVTMTGLRFEGIVELDTGAGKLRTLKFSMAKSVTDDFLLQADGPGGKTMRYVTDRLTVQGDVVFYATRFVGRLLGIKITLTPDLPFPDGIPVTSPIPITFTDPVIDLAYVDSDVLTGEPELKLSLA